MTVTAFEPVVSFFHVLFKPLYVTCMIVVMSSAQGGCATCTHTFVVLNEILVVVLKTVISCIVQHLNDNKI